VYEVVHAVGGTAQMRTTVSATETIEASPAAIFDCVADYAVAPLFIEGLQRLTPVSSSTAGEGARFDAVMRVGPRTIRTTIEITAYEEGRLVTWASANGHSQLLTFELTPQAKATKVVLEISYEAPGGLAGVLSAPVVEETVRIRARSSLRRLREHVV
jgi:uncharacterized membrane protein